MKYALLLISFFIVSCAQKVLVPLSNGVEADPRKLKALYRDERIRIEVRTGAWKGYPSDLEGYLLPIYLEVQNLSRSEIDIRLSDIRVIDDRGRQFNALTPKDASELARGSPSVGFSIGVGIGTPHWGLGWWGPPYYYEDVSDIVKRAFIEGSVLPGRKVSGFVYFQDLPKDSKRIELRISYSVEGVVYDVIFPFEVKHGKDGSYNGNKENRQGSGS